MKLKTKLIALGLIAVSAIGGFCKVSEACQLYENYPSTLRTTSNYVEMVEENPIMSQYSIVSSLPTCEKLLVARNTSEIVYDDSMIPNDSLPDFVEPNRPEEVEEVDIWNLPIEIDENDVKLLANVMYGEARGIKNDRDKAAVAWCILNRVDSTMRDFKNVNTIYAVITQKYQFSGYGYNNPHTDELMALARDVLYRWNLEKLGYEDVGRVLPKDYYWFLGDGKYNYFTNIWCKGNIEKAKKNAYNWALGSPYDEE